MSSLADWKKLEQQIVQDLLEDEIVTVKEYEIAGRNYEFRSLDEIQRFHKYVKQQIAELSSGSGSSLFRNSPL